MIRIPFVKMSGAGNDFVVIDNRDSIIPHELTNFLRKICQRRVSIGADGVLLVEESDLADFKMCYFNSDGKEVETCGNGARCISLFAYLNGIAPDKMCFETKVGIYQSEVIKSNVRVRLGNPTQVRLNFPLQLNDGVHNVSFASTGVPHVVFLVEKLEEIDVTYVGTQIRYHKDFEPAGTNANFVQVRSNQEIDVRTYERGVEDETFACGTGSVAGVVILAVNGKVSSPVKVNTLSGFPLTVYFNLAGGEVQDIYLEGDARFICEGQISESAWKY